MSTATEVQRGALAHPDVQSLDEVNRDILRPLGRPGRGWWGMLALALTGMGIGGFAWSIQVWQAEVHTKFHPASAYPFRGSSLKRNGIEGSSVGPL